MAMMAFKTLGYITMSQGTTYAMDQKMAMYMKVPPKTIFWGQFWASVWSCFVQVGVVSSNPNETGSIKLINSSLAPLVTCKYQRYLH